MKKGIAYARYSSFNQNEISIVAQLRAIHQYAANKGISVDREYIDEAKTATSDSRPNFLHMIADLELTRPDLVLVHKLDRFARNRIDAALYRKEIQDVGARLIAVDQDFGDGPEAILMEAVLEGNAEWFSKNLSREVKKGLYESVVDNHRHCGGIPPLGYDVDHEGHYVINEYESDAIKMIFKMKLEGMNYSSIIGALNNAGYQSKKGHPFGKNSIHDILRNEKYIGNYIYHKTSPHNSRVAADPLALIRMEGVIPAIIDSDTWARVQEMMDGRKCLPRSRSDTTYILTGLIRCAECGQAMIGGSEFQSGKKYEYYRCNLAKRTAGTGCSNKTRYRKNKLEEDVLDKVHEAIKMISVDNFEEYINNVYADYMSALVARDVEHQSTRRELSKVQREMDNLISSIAAGVDATNIAPRLNDLGKKKSMLERKNQRKKENITIESIRERTEKILALSFSSDDPVQCRHDLNEILESVIVSESAISLSFKEFGLRR